jgi:1-phosphatidylinositol phosphodiesterase
MYYERLVIIINKEASMDLSNWQKIISGTLPLSLINLPGTHDSSTQFVTLSLFSRCQNTSIKQQLENGIRFLDIRLELRDSIFYAVHGIANCRTSKKRRSPLLLFQDIFSNIQDFTIKHPSETIIVAIKMDRGTNTDEFFPTFYEQFVEQNISRWFLENRIPALDECRGRMVLLRRCVTGKSHYTFDESNSGLNFTNSFDSPISAHGIPLPGLVETIDPKYPEYSVAIQDSFMLNPVQKWKKAVKPALDNFAPADNSIAIHYLSTAGMPFIPRINSRYINSKFYAYPLQNRGNCGWICFDFPASEQIVKTIKSNFE